MLVQLHLDPIKFEVKFEEQCHKRSKFMTRVRVGSFELGCIMRVTVGAVLLLMASDE